MAEEQQPVEFTEERIPVQGIEEAIGELVDLYGGEMRAARVNERDFILPMRRGVAAAGGVQCTVSWAPQDEHEATVRLKCDREVNAPKVQRVALLAAGVIGAMFFMIWPFFPHQQELGTLSWMGGIIALAVYFMSLRRTSGGLAFDFLQRLVRRQRGVAEAE